jgi:predicted ATPase
MQTIARICRHVTGMPLAIEHAATLSRTLPLAEIERQMTKKLELFTTRLRDLPARHRSLRALFEHSWQKLDMGSQIVLSRLAIFSGSWTAEAAYCVAEANPLILAALIDASFVHPVQPAAQDTPGTFEPRFTLLEPLRTYALEQLLARGEEQAMRQAYARYATALAETNE